MRACADNCKVVAKCYAPPEVVPSGTVVRGQLRILENELRCAHFSEHHDKNYGEGVTHIVLRYHLFTKAPPKMQDHSVEGKESLPYAPPACIAVIATTFTMSSASQPRERSLAASARPCRIGPKASAPPIRCVIL